MTPAVRYALFGGSFDPVHHGHLMLAELLRESERLQRIVFVPAWQSPHKPRCGAPGVHRIAMLRLAVRGNAAFRVSDIEMRRGGPSYTIDTVRTFARRWKKRPWLLLGGDALVDLPTWRDSEALRREARIVVFARPGFAAAKRRAARLGFRYHELTLSTLSSSEVRGRVRRGRSIRYRVPEAVRRYIERHRLYGIPPEERR
jgi:nicotinate-nucleotide adenylyltransferase